MQKYAFGPLRPTAQPAEGLGKGARVSVGCLSGSLGVRTGAPERLDMDHVYLPRFVAIIWHGWLFFTAFDRRRRLDLRHTYYGIHCAQTYRSAQ